MKENTHILYKSPAVKVVEVKAYEIICSSYPVRTENTYEEDLFGCEG